MTEEEIRPARREDVPAIVGLLADDTLGATRERLEDPLPEAYWRAWEAIERHPSTRILVAELDGVVVGTLQLDLLPSLSRGGMRRAQVDAVRVASGLRGSGLGRRLMIRAIEEARREGCGLVQLTTDRRRADALRFYARLGFVDSHHGLKLALT